MKQRAAIVGDHPIVESIVKQYDALQFGVTHQKELDSADIDINLFDELFLISDVNAPSAIDADNKVIMLLGLLAQDYQLAEHLGEPLRCHLLLQSQEMLQQMRTCDYHEAIRTKVEVCPFTMDEQWSQSIRLDWQPITKQSERAVHLVVFGAGGLAESIAIHAALVAHFPNYVHNHSLRTRITVVDENSGSWSQMMTERYRQLFDNSFYRMVNPSQPKMVTSFHQPNGYTEKREFVDVEWEFVDASVCERTVRTKLQQWAESPRQLLTLVFAHKDESRNLAEAMCLPDKVFQESVPIYVYQRHDIMSGRPHPRNIHPFGMIDSGYDVTLPIVSMAKNVNYVYDQCYNDNDERWSGRVLYTIEIDAERRDALWRGLKMGKRMSNIYNAMTIPVKMRSLGLKEDEWERFYDISQQDIDLLAEVEHNRWSVEELILGWRPCNAQEEQEVERDINKKEELKTRMIHYDLRPYNDLRPDATGKSVKIYDQCICASLPLIAKAAANERHGEKGGEP